MGECTATETHLICSFNQIGGSGHVIFRRPTSELGAQRSDSNDELLLETVHLDPVLVVTFPDTHTFVPHVIPRSPTSFVIVQACQNDPDFLNQYEVTIRVLLFTTSDEKISFEEIGLMTIPGWRTSSFLSIPPMHVHYALGVLVVKQLGPAVEGTQIKHEYFAVKIDLPCLEQNPTLENECQINLTRMHLAPAIDELEEEAVLYYFDYFSGRVVLSVSRGTPGRADVVIDYLTTAM